jgi:hypothetical protein
MAQRLTLEACASITLRRHPLIRRSGWIAWYGRHRAWIIVQVGRAEALLRVRRSQVRGPQHSRWTSHRGTRDRSYRACGARKYFLDVSWQEAMRDPPLATLVLPCLPPPAARTMSVMSAHR